MNGTQGHVGGVNTESQRTAKTLENNGFRAGRIMRLSVSVISHSGYRPFDYLVVSQESGVSYD